MKTECEVIRDLLPLYADDVCSEGSRRMIEEHLPECPECAAVLEQLKTHEIETGLQEEKQEVIAFQAKKFKRRSTTVGTVIAGIFMIPVLVCLIVNLSSGLALDWFFIVLAALAVAASLIIVPLIMPENKLLWTFGAFCASLMVLLAVCSIYSGGWWFFTAASASLFGLSVIFLPFVVKAKPVKAYIGNFSRALAVLAVDVILFANMMNMITLFTKNVFASIIIEAGCVGGLWLLKSAIEAKRGEEK